MKNEEYISIIVPVYNEEESLPLLYEKIVQTFKQVKYSWELVIVDDGSSDNTVDVVKNLITKDKRVKILSLRRNFGKSAALTAGFENTNGNIVITMDGDLQDEPEEIPKMLLTLEEGYDLVTGWKQKRKDPLEKRLPSKLFNKIVSLLTGLKLNDYNSGFKIYRRWAIQDINLTSNLHRFIPILVWQRGGKVKEIPVKHNAREYGKSKYGIKRYLHGLTDLITVILITRFLVSPLYFFGLLGLPFIAFGSSIFGYLLWGHVYHYLINNLDIYKITSRPLLLISFFSIGLGVHIILMGLLAEFILRLTGKKAYYLKNITKSGGF